MVKTFLKRVFRLEESPAKDLEAQPEIIYMHRKPLGSHGTEIYSGYITEEYLTTLRGTERAKIFDKMRRSDPQIRMLLSGVKNPILSANWEIEAADDSPEAQEDKELIEYILFKRAYKPFRKILAEALTCVDFGASAMEKTFELVQEDPVYGFYHGIAGLDWISPKTIERWNVDCHGKLETLTQIANGDLQRYVDIPSPFLLVFSLDQEGSNYEGISWLRPLYGNWFRKNVFLKLNAIGVEKFAVPTPIIKIPDEFQNSAKFDNLLAALEVYTSGESNYLAVPQGLEITFEKNVYDPQKVDMAIASEDTRMAKAFQAMFMELGTGANGGAFALSNDLSDFFLSGIKHIATDIADVFNAGLIPELIIMNRGRRASYPKLVPSGIDDKAGKELSEVLGILIDKKVIEPDLPLEENMRKRFGLPKKSDIGRREVNPAPSFGGGYSTLSERARKRIYG